MKAAYWKILLALAALIFFVFYPFEYQIAPEWVARVVDEDGHGVSDVDVSNSYQEYSLEETSHEDHALTESDGVVRFPPHKMRASIASRVVGCVRNFRQLGVHASCGTYAWLVAYKCNYGWLLNDVGRTRGDYWRGWSNRKNATLFLRRCPPGHSGVGCASDEEMNNRACIGNSSN